MTRMVRVRPTTVVNVRTAARDEWDVYIGRAVSRARDPRCRVASIFANPWRAGRECPTAEDACDRYEALMRRRLEHGESIDGAGWCPPEWWARALRSLSGKRLGCWCHPDPCHGHVLVTLIDELVAEGGA